MTDRNANRRTVLNYRNNPTCYLCNGKNHRPENCFFRNKVCSGCHTKGHKEAACRLKTNKNENNQGNFKKTLHLTVKQISDIPIDKSMSTMSTKL